MQYCFHLGLHFSINMCSNKRISGLSRTKEPVVILILCDQSFAVENYDIARILFFYWIFYVLHVSWYLSLLGVFYFFVPGAVENRLERFAVAVALLLVLGSTCFSNKFIIARNIKFYEYLTNLRSRLDARLLDAQQIQKK